MASCLDTDDFFSYTEEAENFKTPVYKACVFFYFSFFFSFFFFCILAWKVPWTEELGRLQSIGPQRAGYSTCDLILIYFVCVLFNFKVETETTRKTSFVCPM